MRVFHGRVWLFNVGRLERVYHSQSMWMHLLCAVQLPILIFIPFVEIHGEASENELLDTLNLRLDPSTRLLADCLTTSLYCLTVLSLGRLPAFSSLRTSAENLLTKVAASTTAPDDECLSRIVCLARCLDAPKIDHAVEIEVKLNFNRDNLSIACLLDEDTLGVASSQSEVNDESNSTFRSLNNCFPKSCYLINWLVVLSSRLLYLLKLLLVIEINYFTN